MSQSRSIANYRPFKASWEKTNFRIEISDARLDKIVKSVLPNHQVKSYHRIKGGCANLNVKLELSDGCMKLLRIYIRDDEASYREQAVAKLIHKRIPVPIIEKIINVEGLQLALCEYKSGITLRELLLSEQTYEFEAIMYQVGEIAARFQKITFPVTGFFDRQLKITKSIANDECISFYLNRISGDLAFHFEKAPTDLVLFPMPTEAHFFLNNCVFVLNCSQK